MTIKQAIERLNFMIQQHICYEEVVLEDDNEDAQEELHETEVELEALRMAVQALEEKPRWIPCAERLPSDENKVLCCTQTKAGAKNIVLGYYAGGKWRCGMNSNVVAWMPLPEVYRRRIDMKTRPRDYLTEGELLCQLAEESAELAQAALKERRTLTSENPTPKTFRQAHIDLLEEVADVYVSLGELLSLADWETVAHIRAEKENRWIRRLEERESK